MARHLRKAAELGLEAVAIEGGLIAPEQVAAIAGAARDAKLAASYDVPKGLALADEISRYFRIGQGIWRDYDRINEPTTTQTAAFVRDLLTKAFGFDDLTGPVDHRDGTRRYRIALEARGGRVPVVVAPAAEDDRGRPIGFTRALPEFGDGSEGRARRSPIVLLQDWLNANPSFYWGMVFAGDRVRLMRDNASLTRAAWIEADLGAIFRDEMFADFTAWWLLTHASRFGPAGAPPSNAPLEQAREAGLKQGTAARERLREGVETALTELGQGLIEANPSIREQLAGDPAATMRLFEELLRTVYRLIFLAVAEERDLLHPRTTGREARSLYESSYSFAFWRDRSARRAAYDAHHDAWEGMKVTLAALEQGQPVLGLPALGGLFARGGAAAMNAARIPNRRFLRAIWSLGFIEVDSTRTRINWRDMRTEELGSVYESLLELRPALTPAGEFTLAAAKGNARKTSGSYYTPDSLVETLLDSALDPVLEQAQANGGADAILDLKLIDPACGSGHFLLGAARRMAGRVAALRDPDAPDEQAALRDVVSRCIHGVDRNPMAVELAKVALWIESVSPGQPLGFLDANIRCGDALLGVFNLDALEDGVPDAAYKPLTGDDKNAAKYYAQQNKGAKKGQGQFDWAGGAGAMPPRRLAANLSTIRRMPEDTVGQVERKREAFEAWRHDPARYATRVACDLYVAAFLLPKTEVPLNHGRNVVPTTAEVRAKLGGGQVYGPLEGAAVDAAATARAFHWPLAFPDVMIERGGFDVVLGNPPWEKFTILEREFFAGFPEIADEPNASKRKQMIAAVFEKLPAIETAWDGEQRLVSAFGEFVRSSGRFRLAAVGELNLYPLFAELALTILSNRGRAGLILKSMMFTGSTWKEFTDELITTGILESVLDFKNWNMLFANVGYHERYSLATFVKQAPRSPLRLSVGLTHPQQLAEVGATIEVDRSLPRQLNPDTGTLPQCESPEDLRILSRVAERFPTLGGSSWRAHYTSGLHMTFDAAELRDFEELRDSGHKLEGAWLVSETDSFAPVYEGKLIHQYDHRFATFEGIPRENRFGIKAATITPTADEKASRDYEILPRYWVRRAFQESNAAARGLRKDWNIAFRDTTNVISNFRTAVACVVGGAAFNYKAPNVVINNGDVTLTALFLSLFNSTPFDYLVRQKFYGANFTKSMLTQSFVVSPDDIANWQDRLIDAVVELTNTSDSVSAFSVELGRGDKSTTDPERRLQLRSWIDAVYFRAFGFNYNEIEYVFDTFPIWKDRSEATWGTFREKNAALRFFSDLE